MTDKYTSFQFQVLGMLGVIAANTADNMLIQILWTLFAIYCFASGIVRTKK